MPGARVLVNGNFWAGSSCDHCHPEEGDLAEMPAMVGVRNRQRSVPSGFQLSLWPRGFLLSLKEQGELFVSLALPHVVSFSSWSVISLSEAGKTEKMLEALIVL